MSRVVPVNSLSLVEIQNLANSLAYGGERILSGNTAATLLCVAAWLSDLNVWDGVADDLSVDEIDEIDELVADIVHELISGDEPIVSDYVKIAEAIATSDCASLTIDNFDAGTFNMFKLFISGLKTNYANMYTDGILIQFNDYDENSDYNSFSTYDNIAQAYRYQHLVDSPGMVMEWGIPTEFVSNDDVGNFEATIARPQSSDRKTIVGECVQSGTVSIRIPISRMQGSLVTPMWITSITVLPRLGSLFKINPTYSEYPDELRMTLYGLK